MILYFSATGNTKLIAQTLAKRLDDEAVDLLSRIKKNDYSEIKSDLPFVICSPVYVSELPLFFLDHLKKLSLSGSNNVYGILTNGGYSGIAGGQLKGIIKRKNMAFMGYAEFKLPSNHITNKSHKVIGADEIKERIKTSLDKADEIAEVIKNGGSFKNRHIFFLEYAATLPVAPLLCHINQGTEGFWIKDSCIFCGKCEKLCPMNVISIQDGKPVWNIKRCAHCMSCIQNCPVEAIEYKDITKERKRYNASKYRFEKTG